MAMLPHMQTCWWVVMLLGATLLLQGCDQDGIHNDTTPAPSSSTSAPSPTQMPGSFRGSSGSTGTPSPTPMLGSSRGGRQGPPPAGGGAGKAPASSGQGPPAAGGGAGKAPASSGQGPPAAGGGAGKAPASSSSHAAPMLGDIAKTVVAGTDVRTGKSFAPGENVYGPFEAGFGSAQNMILERLGCSDGSLGHVAGGIDTQLAEQMVASQCGITLPRTEGNSYISLLDECGGHTQQYHFHERLTCLYNATSGEHSTKVAQALDGKLIYGKWEHTVNQVLPLLDACGGHFGPTPESPNKAVYHYHVQDRAPFTVGCFGPNDDNSLVTVEQCRSFYTGCDGNLATVTTPSGTKEYDDWCPCYDANGSNSGINIATLPVFQQREQR